MVFDANLWMMRGVRVPNDLDFESVTNAEIEKTVAVFRGTFRARGPPSGEVLIAQNVQ